MPIIALDDLSLRYGSKVIFDGAQLAIERGDRLGIVGANGTGKSTLLKILAGRASADGGQVLRTKDARLGYLAQELDHETEGPLLQSVLQEAPGRESLQAQLAEVEESLQHAEDEEAQLALAQSLAELHHQLAELDHVFGPHQAKRILSGLGFAQGDFDRPVGEFSGGWRMRAALASLLFQRPDVLLLDEPTNHLDMPSVNWLSSFLKGFKHAIVLTCHDREFLNRHVARVASLELEGLRTFRGNYDEYLEQRELDLSHLKNRIKREEQRKKELESFVERFKAKATKARQAQSKAKMLEKLQDNQGEIPQLRKTISIKFQPTERSGDMVVRTLGLSKRYGDHVVFQDLDLMAKRQDRIAIVGRNGAGKTTLLRLIAGELEASEGDIELGQRVSPSYFAQHHADSLNPHRCVLDEVWDAAPGLSQTQARSICGAFLFSGDEVDKPVQVLSGGEKTRVAMARILAQPGNLLLLDEPTNHLDTESADRLTASLESYDGTLLFVSHNLDFARRLSNKVWDVQRDASGKGTVRVYPGSLADYLDHLDQEQAEREQALTPGASQVTKAPQDKAARIAARQEAKRAQAEARKRRNQLERQIKAAEAQIEKLEAEQAQLEEALADPSTHSEPAKARELSVKYDAVRTKLEAQMESWTDHQAQLEALEAEPT